eukprot:11946212-Karenia_brevis.AAC.1
MDQDEDRERQTGCKRDKRNVSSKNRHRKIWSNKRVSGMQSHNRKMDLHSFSQCQMQRKDIRKIDGRSNRPSQSRES